MDDEDLISELQGELVATQMLLTQVIEALRAKDILTEGELARIFDGASLAAEIQPDGPIAQATRRGIERFSKRHRPKSS